MTVHPSAKLSPMRRMSLVILCVGNTVLAGCSKSHQDGLPPATEWQASPLPPSAGDVAPMTPPPGMAMAGGGNPHGGDPSNPHAGLDMDGDGDVDEDDSRAATGAAPNPHGAGGTDVTKLGLAAPDPNRAIDPSHRVTGLISVDAKAKDRVKPGTAIFLIVKRAGPGGVPSGPPLAVDKLTWTAAGVPFELTDAQAMVAGTELSGDVVVMARYDQDSDALSKQPGDVTGQVSVKIPADHVKLTLDTVLP